MPTIPIVPFGNPGLRVISVHVSPPSVDLKMPLPGPPLSSVQGLRETSHKPAYITLGFVGSMIKSQAPALSLR